MYYKGRNYFVAIKLVFISIAILFSSIVIAKAADPVANNIRIGAHSNKTRFVIDISDNIEFRAFTLSDPYRVVIDLPEIGWSLPEDVVQRNLKQKNSLILYFVLPPALCPCGQLFVGWN